MDGSRIPRHRDPSRLVVGEQLEQHVREAEQRVRRLSVRRLQLLGEREERPVGEVVSVDEEQLGSLDRPVIEHELVAGEGLGRHVGESTGTLRVLRQANVPVPLPVS